MNEDSKDKKYKAFKIPDKQQAPPDSDFQAPPQTKASSSNGLFYELEYGSYPIEGVGKFVLKPQKIEVPQKDEIRKLFYDMRDISMQYRSPLANNTRFYDRKVQQDNAKIFYKQAMFMKDFEDDYLNQVPFSSYFPYYQMLSYEQLRTYFTWRTQVRKGVVENTSLSYAFLYIYELLNNIGADSPQDGLNKLVSFWNSFKEYGGATDKYVLRWLKDYHIYYNLPQEFNDFVQENNLSEHYPKSANFEDSFDLFCAISKYDIRKSVFFTEETSELITNCFSFVFGKIEQAFDGVGINLYNTLLNPTKKAFEWKPFKDSLFYQWLKQPDRRVVISQKEIYMCVKNEWTFSTVITTQKGKQFIGYIMKQMESSLRELTKYKFKITVSIDMINQETLSKLKKLEIQIDKIVELAVAEFYRELTKTVVEVNPASLAKIRQEALATQEALIVEEQTKQIGLNTEPIISKATDQSIFADFSDTQPALVSDVWVGLKKSLNANELHALLMILQGDSNIKQFADDNGVMLEVFIDGINEKAMDYIGDNLLDDELSLYEDYEEQVKEMVKSL